MAAVVAEAEQGQGQGLSRKKVAVIGAGAFGTAIATVAARNEHNVVIYARKSEIVDSINNNHVNPHYVKEFTLSEHITASADVAAVLADAEIVILALPVQIIPDWLAEHRHLIRPDVLLCNTAKGLHLKTKKLLSEVIRGVLERDQPYAILSGPSFAKQMMQAMPTAVVVASRFLYHAVTMQRLLSNMSFRVYTSQDVIGVELGGALKNPLAIGAGMIEGLGLGINTMAAYVTRSSMELQELCKAMGGEPMTISGLAGVGDLMLTAFGELSRNRTMGARFAKGEKVEDIVKEMTVEGIPTAHVAVTFADACGLDLPIFRLVAALLAGTKEIHEAHGCLFGRPLGQERGTGMN